jgi:hypothetical protein
LIQDLTNRRRRKRGELTGERDSGEGTQAVYSEGVPVVLEAGRGLYEVRLGFSRWRA